MKGELAAPPVCDPDGSASVTRCEHIPGDVGKGDDLADILQVMSTEESLNDPQAWRSR